AVQQKREAANRQINERLKTLIAAYKTLGGSFTGDLSVDPSHLRDLRRRAAELAQGEAVTTAEGALLLPTPDPGEAGERARRIRDAVEAALSDVILLGTEEQVRLAARAATDMVDGRPIHTAELVVSLRDFIRSVLDLEVIPAAVVIPRQGPSRPASSGGNKGGGKAADKDGGGAGKGGAGGGMGGMGAGMGMGMGAGLGYGAGRGAEDDSAR
ncbi:MAG TPA: hypothetical protein VF513_18685, partial [Stenotrophomonas sp.]